MKDMAHRQPHAHRPAGPSVLRAIAEFAVYVGGLAVLLYVLLIWVPS